MSGFLRRVSEPAGVELFLFWSGMARKGAVGEMFRSRLVRSEQPARTNVAVLAVASRL